MEGTGAMDAADAADAAQGAEADKMTVCHLPPTNRESSSKDDDAERADSYRKDRQDSSHRHRLGVTINQARPRSTL